MSSSSSSSSSSSYSCVYDEYRPPSPPYNDDPFEDNETDPPPPLKQQQQQQQVPVCTVTMLGMKCELGFDVNLKFMAMKMCVPPPGLFNSIVIQSKQAYRITLDSDGVIRYGGKADAVQAEYEIETCAFYVRRHAGVSTHTKCIIQTTCYTAEYQFVMPPDCTHLNLAAYRQHFKANMTHNTRCVDQELITCSDGQGTGVIDANLVYEPRNPLYPGLRFILFDTGLLIITGMTSARLTEQAFRHYYHDINMTQTLTPSVKHKWKRLRQNKMD